MAPSFLLAEVLFFSYLIGSLSPGYYIARWYGIDDIREHGSGNSGATNVARTLGKRFFFITLLLDACKAYGCLWLVQWYGLPDIYSVNSVIALLCGNRWPIFLQFRGGKGVATAFGCMAFLSPQVTFLVVAVWLGFMLSTGVVGIASVGAAIVAPFFGWWFAADAELIFFLLCFIMAWVIMTHKDNIRGYLQA